MTEAEVQNYVNCNMYEYINEAIISWKNWQFYWTLIEASQSILDKDELCYREDKKWYIGMGTKGNFEEAFKICSSFGGRLPMPGL